MERVFSKPASTAGPAGVDDKQLTDRPSPGEIANAGLAGSADIEAALLAVDRAIRSLRLREPLDDSAPVEAPDPGQRVCHHPDSAAVLCSCQKRHPTWRAFPEQTVRVVYQRLLRERCESAVLDRIAHETATTIKRVMRQIAHLAPANREQGDDWWVWCELERTCPRSDYRYTASQVRAAWKRVIWARRRIDFRGKGSCLPRVRRIRRRAIAPLAADLHRPASRVKVLDFDDYDAVVGTVALRGESNVPVIQVSSATREHVERWLTVRGCGAGLLFALPDVPAYAEQPCSRIPGVLEFAPDRDNAADDAVAANELIELCCEDQPENVSRYLLWKLRERGDWPARAMEKLRQLSGADASEGIFQHGLSKKQVHLCRAKLQRRLERLGAPFDSRER